MSDAAATEPVAAKGSTRDYCSYWADAGETHHIVSIRAGEKVRWVERCSFCGWIDTEKLDGWADDAIKKSLSQRAQRIAVSAETEPFSFVQRSDEELPLAEIVYQALGAASVCWVGGTGSLEFDSSRASAVGKALMSEIEQAIEQAMDRRERAVREELGPPVG